jgi:hypothetical protein
VARECARTVVGERKNVRLNIVQSLFSTSFLRPELDDAFDRLSFPEELWSAARIPTVGEPTACRFPGQTLSHNHLSLSLQVKLQRQPT